ESNQSSGEVIIGSNHYSSTTTSGGGFYFHRVDVSGLAPGTAYSYIAGSEGYYSPVYSFLQRGADWEREAYFELFEGNGNSRTVPVSTGVGIRVHGDTSRAYAQKALSVYFRAEYGMNNLQYNIIPGAVMADKITPITKYKSFLLRNGGNDTDLTKMVDVFTQSLFSDRSFTTQAARPCVLYLNGEYWGPFNLEEKYSDNLTEYEYGVTNTSVIAIESSVDFTPREVDTGDTTLGLKLWDAMVAAGTKAMGTQANYDAFCKLMDIDNFIDYLAAILYAGNTDFGWGNFRAWLSTEAGTGPYNDQKWRWQMVDMDAALGADTSGAVKDPFSTLVSGDAKGSSISLMFKALLANEGFCRKLINNIMDIHNVNFSNASSKMNNFVSIYQPLMKGPTGNTIPGYFSRWGGSSSDFDGQVGYVTKYLGAIGNLTGTTSMVNTFLPKYFNTANSTLGVSIPALGITATGLATVTLATNGSTSIKLNTLNLAPGSWNGRTYTYYSANPITVTVTNTSGFTGWTVTGGTARTPNSPTTIVDFTGPGNVTITANY
ncbi:MAG: CotH kinase family protein, partial [Treponema sp.]|nr:CotH kinase family protein [Treponema sp.]